MRRFIPLGPTSASTTLEGGLERAHPVVEVDERNGRIQLAYRFPGFFRSETERTVEGTVTRFDKIDLGVGFLMETGKPVLPSFRRTVAIPAGSDWRVRIATPGRPLELHKVSVMPARVSMIDPPAVHRIHSGDGGDAYERDELYPKDLVLVTGPLEIHGYRALVLHVRPIQYNAKRRLLVGHPRIDVTIDLFPHATISPLGQRV